jgi:hypothetical protein
LYFRRAPSTPTTSVLIDLSRAYNTRVQVFRVRPMLLFLTAAETVAGKQNNRSFNALSAADLVPATFYRYRHCTRSAPRTGAGTCARSCSSSTLAGLSRVLIRHPRSYDAKISRRNVCNRIAPEPLDIGLMSVQVFSPM